MRSLRTPLIDRITISPRRLERCKVCAEFRVEKVLYFFSPSRFHGLNSNQTPAFLFSFIPTTTNDTHPTVVSALAHSSAPRRQSPVAPTEKNPYLARSALPSSCSLFLSILKLAAAMFSSRYSALEVPGISRMTGDRTSGHCQSDL